MGIWGRTAAEVARLLIQARLTIADAREGTGALLICKGITGRFCVTLAGVGMLVWKSPCLTAHGPAIVHRPVLLLDIGGGASEYLWFRKFSFHKGDEGSTRLVKWVIPSEVALQVRDHVHQSRHLILLAVPPRARGDSKK